jgi:hypothetical protein
LQIFLVFCYGIVARTENQELLSGRNTDSAQAEIHVLLCITEEMPHCSGRNKWLSSKPEKI